MKRDVFIRGGGVVGLTLALLLARERMRVTVKGAQSSVSTARDVRSYALSAASRQMLMDLRVWPQAATPVNAMQVWADGERAIEFAEHAQPLAWIVDAQELLDNLSQAIRFAPEVEFIETDTEPDATLHVICEGRVSQARDRVGADFEKHWYEQSAVAAHISCERPHDNTALQWMETGKICAFLPRGESQPGNSVALVWSVPHDEAMKLESMEPAEFEKALERASGGHLGVVRLQGARARWPLMIAQAEHWCGQDDGRSWALVGDAAHAMHPLAGQGLNLGLGDARVLARILAGKPYFRPLSDLRLLRQYERERKADAAMMLLATDGLQRIFSHSDPRLRVARAFGMKSVHAAAPLKAWLMRQASGLSG